MFSPGNIEDVLGYDASSKDKPIRAVEKLEEMAKKDSIPDAL